MKGGVSVATFAVGLSDHLASKPKLTLLERRLKRLLDAKPSKRRTVILAILEGRARDRLGLGDKVGIDWSKIDWAKVLDFLLKLLAIIAPLLA